MLTIIFFWIYICFSRVFRLKHPTDELFVGVTEYAFYSNRNLAALFTDAKAKYDPTKVNILLKSKQSNALEIYNNGFLKMNDLNNGIRMRFKAIHLARDVVAIESAMGGCLQYKTGKSKFVTESCQYSTNFRDQTFKITDELGVWRGSGIYETAWAKMLQGNVVWGVCSTCLEGGFGSEAQGRAFDRQFGIGRSLGAFPPFMGSPFGPGFFMPRTQDDAFLDNVRRWARKHSPL